jgi:non-specific serine/threonine protein kinase
MGARDNLPRQPTSFIGRRREIAAIKQALAESRLVTLTGPGGCGKSRLAIEAAARLRDSFPEGIWLVELDALSDAQLLPQAVAKVLGVQEEPGHELLDTVIGALDDRRLLLLLDNCEQLIDPCAALVRALLQATEVRVLATSREPLRVPGEVVHLVPPLSAPGPGPLPPLADLSQIEAVALFLDRARARQPGFVLTAETAPHVAEICRRLEGLPLAIELAAAAVGTLSVDALAANLDAALEILHTGWRTPTRHASLRATLDWSYARLQPTEQALLARLAVFAGSFSLEAAQAVCTGPGLARQRLLGALLVLTERSLVLSSDQWPEARYRLLEPVRQYAREQLAAQGEVVALEWTHLNYFATWAKRAAPGLAGPEQGRWVERVRREEENLRSALGRALADAPCATLGLELAVGIARFWIVTRQWLEGRQWLGRLLALAPPDAPARAPALLWAAALALLTGDFVSARDLAAEGAAFAHETGERAIAAESQAIMAVALANLGDSEASVSASASVAALRGLEDPGALGRALMGAGTVARLQKDLARAIALHRESADVLRAVGDRYFLAHTLSNLGLALMELGQYAEAEALFTEALAERRALNDRQGIAWSLRDLGEAARARGRAAVARARYLESLALLEVVGDRAGAAQVRAALQQLGEPRGGPTPASVQPPGWAGALTRREHEVLALLARGYTNRQIAAALFISAGTAGIHVQHILAKLGFRSRAQAAAWAVAHGVAKPPPSSADDPLADR